MSNPSLFSDEAIKRMICEGFGVTLEEVEALDRHIGGPEARAQRQAAEERMLAWADICARRTQADLLELAQRIQFGEVGDEDTGET